MMNRTTSVLLSVMCAVAVSSCSSLNANSLPQPGGNYRGGYDIVIEFANVLNLPDRAKVVLDGTTVGVVENVAVGKSDVDVTARIDPAVQVPSNISAVLQQATVLGDIYVALNRPTATTAGGDGSAALASGGRIPLAQTTSPPQLEDTLASLANFVASGSIQRVQSAIININRVTPQRTGQVREIASRVSRDLADLSNNVDTVDQWLNGVADTQHVLAGYIPQIQYFFSPVGMTGFNRVTEAFVAVSTLLPSIGSIYSGGYWLVPLLKSLGVAVGSVQQSKVAIEQEAPAWRQLFTDMFLPQDKYPAMNITSVETADGRDITGRTQDILRMLGATP